MKRKYKIACLGGTFDVPMHKGHEALIKKAFGVSTFCYMGLTTDDYVLRKGKRGVREFEKRKANLIKFMNSQKIAKSRYEITRLDNFFGKEVLNKKKNIEAIVVSEETLPGARGINIIREDFDLKPLEIVKIDTILAKDKFPISSTRIRSKEIDREGRILGK
jgi:pantetheine-phosphate adenylyltransferase